MKQTGQDKGTLLLALIAGLSINGTFAAIFSSIVPFSVFPMISLVLTVALVFWIGFKMRNRKQQLPE
ncbi:Inner membrane protein YijD [compost metagenome]